MFELRRIGSCACYMQTSAYMQEDITVPFVQQGQQGPAEGVEPDRGGAGAGGAPAGAGTAAAAAGAAPSPGKQSSGGERKAKKESKDKDKCVIL